MEKWTRHFAILHTSYSVSFTGSNWQSWKIFRRINGPTWASKKDTATWKILACLFLSVFFVWHLSLNKKNFYANKVIESCHFQFVQVTSILLCARKKHHFSRRLVVNATLMKHSYLHLCLLNNSTTEIRQFSRNLNVVKRKKLSKESQNSRFWKSSVSTKIVLRVKKVVYSPIMESGRKKAICEEEQLGR